MDPVLGVIIGAAIAGLCSIVVELLRRPDRKRNEETHRQLTTNHHVSSPPTALDKLDTIGQQLESLHRRQDSTDLLLFDVKENMTKHFEWHMGMK